jgi:hypothetical protein
MKMRYVPVTMCVAGAVGLSTPWRYIFSLCLNQFGQQYDIDSSVVRSLFADVAVTEIKPVTNHPHGAAAADRSMGSYFIEKFAREIGRKVWFYQCSKSDLRNGRIGSRDWYWAKDAQVKPGLFQPGKTDIQAIVDTDQYVDMPGFLVENFRPTLLYTFQPSQVAADRGEYNYTFNSSNEVVYRVGGGAEYKHQVWNYDTDVLVFSRLFAGKSWFKLANWIPFVTVAYQVDKKQMDSDHQIIALIPIKRWFGPFAILARLLKGNPLRRFRLVYGDFLRLTSQRVDGLYTSTGRVGTLLCGVLKSVEDSALASLARSVKSGLTMMHVKKLMDNDHIGATIVYEYHAQRLPEMSVVSYSGIPRDHVRSYQFKPKEYDSDAKRSLVSFMSPLVDGGFCPALTVGNARQAIEGRINSVRSCSTPTKFIDNCIQEFVEMMYKSVGVSEHSLIPVEPEEVYERQSKPSQRRILELAEFCDGKKEGKSFLKREAYGKISDPRIITTINGNTKYRYSRYVYSFSDSVLKNQKWYAFGLVPFDIAVRVAEICSKALRVSNTDFHRFDGTISEVPRRLERRMMMYGFGVEYANDLLELMRSQQDMNCYLGVDGDSVPYNSGLARASGSPETSAFNTVVNAFCAYLAWRMTRADGGYVDKLTAFSNLGLYGGDDGLSPDLNVRVYEKAAQKLGLNLDIEPIERNDIGVKFLNRHYGPMVWYGDLNSMCDIPRALSKFHLTVSMPSNVSNCEKLRDKSYAYYLSDEHTPYIGMFVTAVVSKIAEGYVFRNLSLVWNAQYDMSVQYPNFDVDNLGNACTPDWMVELAEKQLPDFRVDLLREWISLADGINYFLSPPNNLVEPVEPVVQVEVVVDDDLVTPRPPPIIIPAVKADTPKQCRRGKKRRTPRLRRREQRKGVTAPK